jgi:hypothetical protein
MSNTVLPSGVEGFDNRCLDRASGSPTQARHECFRLRNAFSASVTQVQPDSFRGYPGGNKEHLAGSLSR